jgi:hypothetical protein
MPVGRQVPDGNILNYGAHGEYRTGFIIALSAAQAAGALMSMRWGDATRLMVIDYMEITWIQSGPFTGTQANIITTQIARGFTASDTGGVSILPTGNTTKMRTSMATSLITDWRAVNSAVALVAGTRTLDANSFLALEFVNTITNINPTGASVKFDASHGASHPLVLAQNEGFVISLNGAFPAAGTGTMVVYVQWSEVDAF